MVHIQFNLKQVQRMIEYVRTVAGWFGDVLKSIVHGIFVIVVLILVIVGLRITRPPVIVTVVEQEVPSATVHASPSYINTVVAPFKGAG